MDKQFFFLSPVEVVKVTSQNLEEVAEWCGGSVQETESRRVQGRMDKYVLVPTPSEKQISWAFPGMFITKRLVVTVKDELRATYAVFRRDYFEKNYFSSPDAAGEKTWIRQETEKNLPTSKKPAKKAIPRIPRPPHLTQNLGDELVRAQAVVRELEKKLDAKMIEKEPGDLKIEAEEILLDRNKVQEDLPELHHEHSYLKSCDSQLCSTDRYQDGLHYFTDAIGYAPNSETETTWTNLEGEPIKPPAAALTEELQGKTEAQVEMHFHSGVNEKVDVMRAMAAGYKNLEGLR